MPQSGDELMCRLRGRRLHILIVGAVCMLVVLGSAAAGSGGVASGDEEAHAQTAMPQRENAGAPEMLAAAPHPAHEFPVHGTEGVADYAPVPQHGEDHGQGHNVSSSSHETISILALGCAVVMFFAGRWAYRNAHHMAPTSYSKEGQDRTERALRRGGVFCQVAAGALLVVATAALLFGP